MLSYGILIFALKSKAQPNENYITEKQEINLNKAEVFNLTI